MMHDLKNNITIDTERFECDNNSDLELILKQNLIKSKHIKSLDMVNYSLLSFRNSREEKKID
jgi:hypothetical protein